MHEETARPRQGSIAGRSHNLAPALWAPAILGLIYVCFFSHLGVLGLTGPDEPRYASVARAMVESGDWVTPRLNGQPWFEKPVLYYWTAAISFRLFGVNEFAARLPSALAATLGTLALAWAGWRFYGSRAAWSVLLIFPTCIGTFAFARAATTDMPFSAALAAAMVAALATVRSARMSIVACAGFGVFLGAATLAKGPAALVLAGGSMGMWALASRQWRATLRLAHPVAIVFFCLTALPWYALCAARNPDFLRTFLFRHNIERYLMPMFHHEQPFWFFAPVLLLGLLPWTFLLGGVVRDALRARQQARWAGSTGLFLACWGLFPVLFFSFSKSKLPGYVLPAIAPLALLLARSAARAIEERDSVSRALFGGVGITFVVLAALSSHWLKRLPTASGLADPHRAVAWMLAGVAGGLTVALLALLRRPAAALLVATALMSAGIEAANRRVLPQLDGFLSPRAAARAGEARFRPGEGVFVHRLHRAWLYGLNFYLHRELAQWSPQSLSGWVYTNAAGLAEFENKNVRCTVVERGSPEAILVRVEP